MEPKSIKSKDFNKKDFAAKNCKIIPLPKDQWEGTIIPMCYTTKEYYDVSILNEKDGYAIQMQKRPFDSPVTHYPEKYDFPDKLYQLHWEKAYAGALSGRTVGNQS